MADLLQLSGIELARCVREGKISSTDVVERHIEEIERVNPRINAVVRDRLGAADGLVQRLNVDGGRRSCSTGSQVCSRCARFSPPSRGGFAPRS
jgi:Asp-tRNA(Asn)/Glu-tRNA(Gln) amidotransferase A subunit family amidase